jgi:hypothetical protein
MQLFSTRNPFMYFAAATLGHHALEMFLKAALIATGMTGRCNVGRETQAEAVLSGAAESKNS